MATTYLDHAASTPLRVSAREALLGALSQVGNPSSLHGPGRAARALVETARERVAGALGVRPGEVVWTSGGTEADNLAIQGLFAAAQERDPRRTRVLVGAHEHHAVLEPTRALAARGAQVVELPVDEHGVLRLDVLADELARDGSSTALVSVMWANNEVGALQPVAEVAELARRHGAVVHTDAVQALGQVALVPDTVDAVSLSGHKAGAPVGIGALLVRRGTGVLPVLHGGGQQQGRRPGTEPAALVAAFAAAADEAVLQQPCLAARLGALRDDLVARVQTTVPGAMLRGPSQPQERLPGIAHLTFDGCDGQALLVGLDRAGVAASIGSACQAGVARPSHVLLAMGLNERTAAGALRFSLGHTSTQADVDHLVDVLPQVVAQARAFAGVSR